MTTHPTIESIVEEFWSDDEIKKHVAAGTITTNLALSITTKLVKIFQKLTQVREEGEQRGVEMAVNFIQNELVKYGIGIGDETTVGNIVNSTLKSALLDTPKDTI